MIFLFFLFFFFASEWTALEFRDEEFFQRSDFFSSSEIRNCFKLMEFQMSGGYSGERSYYNWKNWTYIDQRSRLWPYQPSENAYLVSLSKIRSIYGNRQGNVDSIPRWTAILLDPQKYCDPSLETKTGKLLPEEDKEHVHSRSTLTNLWKTQKRKWPEFGRVTLTWVCVGLHAHGLVPFEMPSCLSGNKWSARYSHNVKTEPSGLIGVTALLAFAVSVKVERRESESEEGTNWKKDSEGFDFGSRPGTVDRFLISND